MMTEFIKHINTILVIVVVSSLLPSSWALELSFTDCDNKQVTALRSATCKSDPCRVPIGGHANIEVDFIPLFDAKNITINVFASVFGFEVSLPLDDTNACVEGRLDCPIRAATKHMVRYNLNVKDDYYPVSGDVGFRLTSDDGATVACAMFSAELYTPSEDEPLEPHQEL